MLLHPKKKKYEIPYLLIFFVSVSIISFGIALYQTLAIDVFTEWCTQDKCSVKKYCYTPKKYTETFCPRVCGYNSLANVTCRGIRFNECLYNCFVSKTSSINNSWSTYIFYAIFILSAVLGNLIV